MFPRPDHATNGVIKYAEALHQSIAKLPAQAYIDIVESSPRYQEALDSIRRDLVYKEAAILEAAIGKQINLPEGLSGQLILDCSSGKMQFAKGR